MDKRPPRIMESMTERLARAICWSSAMNCRNTACPHAERCIWKFEVGRHADGRYVDYYLRAGEAAIKAMMVPTAVMVAAGRKEPEELRTGTADCDVNPLRATDRTTLRYQAMIMAALDG